MDCLEFMKTLPDKCIDCVITSPPYNMCGVRGQNWKNSDINYDTYDDSKDEKEYQEWQKNIIKECLRILKPNGSIFYNHKPRLRNHKMILPTDWLYNFDIRQIIIWDRNSTPNINPIGFYQTTEWIIWIKKEIPKFNSDQAKWKEVWGFTPDMKNNHPAPFPIELPSRCILATTNENDIVFDPFLGSGTTAVACKMLKRNYIGCEISPEYCKIAEDRIKSISNTLF